MTRYKSFGGIGSGPMTSSPIPHQRSIRHLERSGNGLMDQSQNNQGPQQQQQIQGRGMPRTPVGVQYNSQPYQREEPFNMPSYPQRSGYPSQMVPQQQYPSVQHSMYGMNPNMNRNMNPNMNPNMNSNYQHPPMGYPQPMMGAQGQNCRLISEHVKNCPYCSKVYKRDSNLLITVIVILLLFIVVLLTKLADK